MSVLYGDPSYGEGWVRKPVSVEERNGWWRVTPSYDVLGRFTGASPPPSQSEHADTWWAKIHRRSDGIVISETDCCSWDRILENVWIFGNPLQKLVISLKPPGNI
ncbi:hypothetical protein TNCT_60461 [Trichonephila clavata]|uniref:Uncharacterized protein n=1 Tax=Trichonephila clavata TaxID=2740835 RepID=A0A8X6L6K4_TRICU|nr:hypothetical protein TNCT_60461 [Trichonephila clavata]